MPRVSIIFPLYNADIRCLDDCIASVAAQTFTDFECIFVNDGSPSRECVDYAVTKTAHDIRFHLVEKENGGLASARNFGFRHSTGELITFIDQDDFLHPQRLEIAIAAMDTVSADVCECKTLRPDFGERYDARKFPFLSCEDVVSGMAVLEGSQILDWYLRQKMNITVWSHVYRRETFAKHPLPECVWGSDDLAYNIVNASRSRRLTKIFEPLYFWRRNPKATTGRVPFAYVEGVVQAIDFVEKHYRENAIPYETENALVHYLAGAFAETMRDTLQIERTESERPRLAALAAKANDLLGGTLVAEAGTDDTQWLKRLLDADFAAAEHTARSVKANMARRKRINELKRKIRQLARGVFAR